MKRLDPVELLGEQEADKGINLREIVGFAWRNWLFIASITALCALAGFVYLVTRTPIYTATTTILLDPGAASNAGLAGEVADPRAEPSSLDNQIAILLSNSLLRRVVERERLAAVARNETSRDAPSLGARLRRWLGAEEAAPPPAEPSAQPEEHHVVAAIQGLRGSIQVSRAGRADVLLISVNSPNQQRAARLANAIADAYVVDKLETRFEATRRASAWLSDRVVELRQELRRSEEAVAQFRETHGLLSASSNLTLSQEQLGELNARVLAARTEASDKRIRLELLEKLQSQGSDIDALPDFLNSGELAGLRNRAADIRRRETELVSRYSDRHPLVVNVRTERRDLERTIKDTVQRLADGVRNEHQLALARQQSLEQSLADVTGQTGADNVTQIRLRELERDAEVNRALFENFLKNARISEERATFKAEDARVLTAAVPPGAPSSPNKMLGMAIALFVGAGLGTAAAFAREMLNAGFTTAEQIESLLQAPVLASVPRTRDADRVVEGKSLPLHQYLVKKPLTRVSEAVRTLRSGVHMADVDAPPKVIQFTSTIPSEGKTTISLAFAASAAFSGQRVLVIDADLRHPKLSQNLGLKGAAGLVDLLIGKAAVKDVLMQPDGCGFFVLPAGSATQNAPDLLASERMRALIDSLGNSFDLIVLDSPPVSPVIDAVVISHLAEKIVFVVKWGATGRELAARALAQVSTRRKVAGVVLNDVNERQAQKYGMYGASPYYGTRYYSDYYSQ